MCNTGTDLEVLIAPLADPGGVYSQDSRVLLASRHAHRPRASEEHVCARPAPPRAALHRSNTPHEPLRPPPLPRGAGRGWGAPLSAARSHTEPGTALPPPQAARWVRGQSLVESPFTVRPLWPREVNRGDPVPGKLVGACSRGWRCSCSPRPRCLPRCARPRCTSEGWFNTSVSAGPLAVVLGVVRTT